MAQLCGFPGKLGMDGSRVWEDYQRGEIRQIRDYCETDAMNTYLLYLRFKLMRGAFNQAGYETEVKVARDFLAANAGAEHWKAFAQAWK
jgi:predicted PolB exonuclease-like 3'-5' exonuclease